MKKILISSTAACAVAFMLAGCGSGEISAVKDGTFKYDESISVGDAIENKPYCADVKWNSQKEGGRLVVSARCEIDKRITQEYIDDKLSDYNKKIAELPQEIAKLEKMIQPYNEPKDIL
ncbi:hypothetical protein [Campylobacter sp. 19-13652]|uniref:hypothetical protein n=1 Tax=Campylobacter sp. 19-13652 TaxID=2840180 RepID=UPI001C799C77|nr:hypothetical protein [Campylobacter sp. 19-13652]BCX79554.1 hypothetical protein LBC_10160 [Campylobacter sp. 19-13652]